MTTADTIRELALSLARSGTEREEAIHGLERAARGRRVPVVRARQQMISSLEDRQDPITTQAIELLDELLGHLPA